VIQGAARRQHRVPVTKRTQFAVPDGLGGNPTPAVSCRRPTASPATRSA